jgi:hypothetical protein
MIRSILNNIPLLHIFYIVLKINWTLFDIFSDTKSLGIMFINLLFFKVSLLDFISLK